MTGRRALLVATGVAAAAICTVLLVDTGHVLGALLVGAQALLASFAGAWVGARGGAEVPTRGETHSARILIVLTAGMLVVNYLPIFVLSGRAPDIVGASSAALGAAWAGALLGAFFGGPRVRPRR